MNYSRPFERISHARRKTHPLSVSFSLDAKGARIRKYKETRERKIRDGKEAVFPKVGEGGENRRLPFPTRWKRVVKKIKIKKIKENALCLKFSRGSREPRARDNLVNEKPSGYVIS